MTPAKIFHLREVDEDLERLLQIYMWRDSETEVFSKILDVIVTELKDLEDLRKLDNWGPCRPRMSAEKLEALRREESCLHARRPWARPKAAPWARPKAAE